MELLLHYRHWISHNLHEKLKDKSLPFKMEWHPYPFKVMKFHEAANYTANLIHQKYNKIYIAYSGGADSEYILKCFTWNNIPIKPIIIITPANKEEGYLALKKCKELHITPVVITLTEEDMIDIYQRKVVGMLNGDSITCVTCIVAANYVKEHDGIMLTGDHLFDDATGAIMADVWNYYNDIFYPNSTIIFFNYTLELFYSMLVETSDIGFNESKYVLYDIPKRDKIKYQYSIECERRLKLINRRKFIDIPVLHDRQQVIAELSPFIIPN